MRAKTAASRRRAARRDVFVKGEWHLWLYFCDWTLYQGKRRTASWYSTDRRIGRALFDLDGQALTRVDVSSDLRRSTFEFDLGGRNETVADDTRPTSDEQWLLFEPSGEALTDRADGHYHHAPGNTPPDKSVWLRYRPEADA